MARFPACPRDTLPQPAQIDYIARWIDDGCPMASDDRSADVCFHPRLHRDTAKPAPQRLLARVRQRPCITVLRKLKQRSRSFGQRGPLWLVAKSPDKRACRPLGIQLAHVPCRAPAILSRPAEDNNGANWTPINTLAASTVRLYLRFGSGHCRQIRRRDDLTTTTTTSSVMAVLWARVRGCLSLNVTRRLLGHQAMHPSLDFYGACSSPRTFTVGFPQTLVSANVLSPMPKLWFQFAACRQAETYRQVAVTINDFLNQSPPTSELMVLV